MNAQTPVMNFSQRIDQYIKLRAKKKELQDAHKAEIAKYNDALEKLEGLLLTWLDQTGQDNAKTSAGTVYKKERKSASLDDPALFLGFVIDNQAWDLMDRKANVTAVADYLDEHGETPPGVKLTREIEVGVLSPKK
jgi:hypothetical protein